MDPEDENSNIEYKRFLPSIYDNKKLSQLSAQMNRRINNGVQLHNKSEAIYYLGVNDDGSFANITLDIINSSITTLTKVAQYTQLLIEDITIEKINDSYIAKVYIRKIRDNSSDIRILFLGDEQTGKTTTISVLANNIKDNGYGSARKSSFKYKRELVNGFTTSVREENICYNGPNRIYYDDLFNNSIYEVINSSTKVATLIDTPGNQKYSKITYGAIFSYKPDHIYIVHNNNDAILLKYVQICQIMDIPFTILITKIDIISTNYVLDFPSIYISNVTLNGIDTLVQNIYQIQKKTYPIQYETEYIINEVVQNNNYGLIVGGILVSGYIKNNDKLLIGMIHDGKNEFNEIKIKTIHKKQIPCNFLNQSDDGSILIELNNHFKITKRMTIFSSSLLPHFISTFYINIISHSHIKFEKNMKLWMFVSNLYEKIYIDKIITINCNYVYKCHIHKHKKKLLKNNDYVGIKFNHTDLAIGIISLDL